MITIIIHYYYNYYYYCYYYYYYYHYYFIVSLLLVDHYYIIITIIIIITTMAVHSGSAPWNPHTVGFHNSNLRIFNLRFSNPNKWIVDVVFDMMSDFNVPESRPNKNTMKFRKSTVSIVQVGSRQAGRCKQKEEETSRRHGGGVFALHYMI